SDWYLAQGRDIPALQHAFDSGDLSYALDLLKRHAEQFLALGRLRPLTRWLDPVVGRILDGHPLLRAVHACAVTFTRGPQEGLRLIDGIDPEAVDDPVAAAYVRALQSTTLGMMDRVDEALRLA